MTVQKDWLMFWRQVSSISAIFTTRTCLQIINHVGIMWHCSGPITYKCFDCHEEVGRKNRNKQTTRQSDDNFTWFSNNTNYITPFYFVIYFFIWIFWLEKSEKNNVYYLNIQFIKSLKAASRHKNHYWSFLGWLVFLKPDDCLPISIVCYFQFFCWLSKLKVLESMTNLYYSIKKYLPHKTVISLALYCTCTWKCISEAFI